MVFLVLFIIEEGIKGVIMKKFLLSISTSFILLGCNSLYRVIEFDEKTFNKEWAAWERQGIVDYSIKQNISTFMPLGEARILVKDNVIIENEAIDKWSATNLEENQNNLPPIFHYLQTISKTYVSVKETYNESLQEIKGGNLMKGITIEIRYNMEFHFPEYIKMSGIYGSGVDGGLSKTIHMSEFMPLGVNYEEH